MLLTRGVYSYDVITESYYEYIVLWKDHQWTFCLSSSERGNGGGDGALTGSCLLPKEDTPINGSFTDEIAAYLPANGICVLRL